MQEETLSRGCVTLVARPERPSHHAASHPVEVNSGAMLATGASIGAIRLASDVIRHVWWPAQAPISFDVEHLSARLQEAVPEKDWTPWRVRRYRAWALTFFASNAAGEWAPIADYYQVAGHASSREAMPARRA